jgi:hypothetical protein
MAGISVFLQTHKVAAAAARPEQSADYFIAKKQAKD